MFVTLDEQFEATEGGHRAWSSRLARFVGIALVLVAFFGALYFAIASFE